MIPLAKDRSYGLRRDPVDDGPGVPDVADRFPRVPVGPATPNGRRNSSADWRFPFPVPGRWQGKKRLPANTEMRQPWVDVDAYDATKIAPRFVHSPVSADEVKRHILTFADDVGLVSVDHPALAHEL